MSGKAGQFFKHATQGTDASDAQVTWFIEKKWVDINVTDKLGCNAVHYAVAKNRPDLIKWLAEHGIDINHQNQRGRTPLHTAAEKGRPHIVDVLIEHGGERAMEIFDKDGRLPLHVAAASCELHTLKALIRHGAEVNMPAQDGKTAMALAGSGHRNLHMLGAIKAHLDPKGPSTPTRSTTSAPGSERGIERMSVQSDSQPNSATTMYALSALGSGPFSTGAPSDSGLPPREGSSVGYEAPENMVLGLHLARKLAPMVTSQPHYVDAAPHLKDKLETLEPLMKSLHRALSRRTPPEDAEPHVQPVLSTLVELWHVVDKASKPPSGLKRLTRSLTGGSGRAAAEVARLDSKLHQCMEAMTQQLLHQHAPPPQAPPAPSWQRVDTSSSTVSSSLASVTGISGLHSSTASYATAPPTRMASGVPPPQHTPQPRGAGVGGWGRASVCSSAAGSDRAEAHEAPPGYHIPPDVFPKRQQGDSFVMVGMETQVTTIVDLLKAPESCGVVLVHGPLGVGKTATAKAAFERLCKTMGGVPALWVASLVPGMGEREVVAVQRDIGWRLTGQSVEPQSAEEGRAVLRVLLGGRRMVLAIDGIYGEQLADLLPLDLPALMADGSALLLTSRNPHAASALLAPTGKAIQTHPLAPLPDEMAAGLFCRRAFNTPWAPHEHAGMVAATVAQCGGLPLALEVTAMSWRQHQRAPELFGNFEESAANRLFAVLHEAIDLLNEEEGEALLDIAMFLIGAPWAAVEAYCGQEALVALERSGLVQRGPGASVAVGAVVAEFCRVVQTKVPGEERVVVAHAADVDVALEDGVRGAWFRGVDLDLPDTPARSLEHAILIFDASGAPGPVASTFPKLQWLTWAGRFPPAPAPALPMDPLSLPSLRVLSLDHLPVSLVSLQSLPLLHHLTLSRLPHLTAILGLPQLPHLTHVALRHLPLLTALANFAAVPFLKSLSIHHCPALAPPAPASPSAARSNGHLLALNNAAFSRFKTLEDLEVYGGWDSAYLSLAECPALKRVAVWELDRVELLAVLGCMAVEAVEVSGCSGLQKVLGVGQLTGLRVLRLEELARMAGVLDLSRCEQLQEVVVRRTGGVRLHPGIEWLKGVRTVRVE